MKESLKSWFLTFLILCSLLQSYFLIYRLPGVDSIVRSENDYIPTVSIGDQLDVESMLYPSQLVIHLGQNKHSVLYPEATFYNLIYARLQGRQFDGFQRYTVTNTKWNEIRSRNQGIELEFQNGIPVSLLGRVMQVYPDTLFEGETVNRLLVYNTENNDQVRAFFFSSEGNVVYEATKVDFTVQDISQMVDFGRDWVPYSMHDGYYVPQQSIDMVQTGLNIGLYSTDQMQRSLFFDPSLTRYVREKDGSEIYTDSKRSLQVKQNRNWINYTDPAAPAASQNTPSRNVLSAIDFVNQHGGWSGKYRLTQITGTLEDKHRIIFEQYYGSGQYGAFPVLDSASFHYGAISLELRQGTITGYERSLIYLEEGTWEKKVVTLLGGEALEKKLAALSSEAAIKAVYPAYLPSITKQGLLLQPVWVAKLSNGAVRTISE